MTAASRQSRRLRKSSKSRRRMVATGLFAAAILVSLVASQCSSSEDSLDDPLSPTTVASTTTSVDAVSTTRVDAPTTTETDSTTTSPPETSPPTTAADDPEDAEQEEQAEETEEQIEEPDSTVSTTTMPRSSDTPSSQISRVSLSSFDECAALLDYIRGEALGRVGPYGFESDDDIIGPFFARAEDDALLAGDIPTPPALDLDSADSGPPQEGRTDSSASALTRGEDFSGTNVQVEGVDEADIVKTDGRRIIGVGSNRSGNNEIWIADIASQIPELQGRLLLSDGYYGELYLAGDRVFVIGTSTVGIDPPGGGGVFENEQANSSDAAADGEIIADDTAVSRIAPSRYANAVVITEVDISDPENPEVMRHLRVEGRYISSRAANGFARVVISSPPESLGFVRPSYTSESSEASAERFNRLLVQESTLDQWLPDYNLHAANGESISRGQLLDCDEVYAPGVFSGLNQVSVLSFATGESLRLRDAVSTVASGETVYASLGNLYVSRVVRDYDADSNSRKAETVIHKFSLDSSGSADYEASGTAIGLPINQYAFHEYQGRLFVATTSGEWSDSESFVTVLEDDGSGALEQVGQVGNLGRGEDIYAVRYIGDKAYVVTFRQIDPLYVVDLSDPTDPTTEGELKITGYSAYLHPVGEDLLLGVGREATDTGRVTGAKVSLFDVSDPADPRTLDSLVLEGGSSEVEWDARAFLWWAPEELAVVPISDWDNDFTGAIALTVDTDDADPKITMRTRISHNIGQESAEDSWGYDWDRQITRSMIINDDLWTLSRSYLQANSIETLDRRAWLDIPG